VPCQLQAIGFSLSADDHRMLAGDVTHSTVKSNAHFHVVSSDHASGTQVILGDLKEILNFASSAARDQGAPQLD
jgi:hypothetical protein